MPKDAVEWHTEIATQFDAGYGRSDNFKERFNIFSELIRRYSGLNKSVIDLGCGAGIFSLCAAPLNRQVTGIDGSDAMIAIGKNKVEEIKLNNNVDFMVRDITTLTTADVKPADLIICSSVLEYIEDIEKSASVIDLLLNEGGTLIVSMPNKSSIYRKFEKFTFYLFKWPKYYQFVKNILTVDEMSGLLAKRNYDIIESHYFSSTPILSKIFSGEIFKKNTNNLFVIVAQKNTQ